MYIFLHTHILHIYIHIYIHIRIYIIYTYTYYIHIHMYICIYICNHLHIITYIIYIICHSHILLLKHANEGTVCSIFQLLEEKIQITFDILSPQLLSSDGTAFVTRTKTLLT